MTVAECWLAGFSHKSCAHRPDGQPDRAHLIPKQRLRQAGVEDVWDERLWVWACRAHHHLFDNHFLRLTSYPASLHEWTDEHGWFLTDRGWLPSKQEARA